MEDSVKERIAQLRAEARDAGIYGKASAVALLKGKRHDKKHGAWHRYEGENLVINWDDFAPNLGVSWKGQRVFGVHLGTVEAYRPDVEDWIEELEFQHLSVKPVLDAEEKADEILRRKALQENWGITVMMTRRQFSEAIDRHIQGINDPYAPFNQRDWTENPMCEECDVEECAEPCDRLKQFIEENNRIRREMEEDWHRE